MKIKLNLPCLSILACLFLLFPSSGVSQSDRDHDCNGVCLALGLTAQQCQEYVHDWHDVRNECTNYATGTTAGPGGCGQEWLNGSWGGFECFYRTPSSADPNGESYCGISGNLRCQGVDNAYEVYCDGPGGTQGDTVPRATMRPGEVRCEGGENWIVVSCNGQGGLSIGMGSSLTSSPPPPMDESE